MQDRNFDDLIERFESRVYDTGKGDWRLKLLKQDLAAVADTAGGLSVWDAGCGFAQISHWLAEKGCQLTLCDVSGKMLDRAKQLFSDSHQVAEFHHASVQQLAPMLPGFDLVLFHAVIEWMAEPLQGLRTVCGKVKAGGYLSLMFYNRNAMVYSNVLKGQWRLRPIIEDSYLGKGHRLTPPNPQYPHEIEQFLGDEGFEIKAHTGIRVFHDYLNAEAMEKTDTQELFELEARYCRMPVYRDMGRYVHILAKKKPE